MAMERSPWHALNVEKHLHKGVVSRNMKVPTLVKSPLHASHVRIHLNTADVLRSMTAPTGKEPFSCTTYYKTFKHS